MTQNGFTILELMVATVVLSVVLLIATMTILGVGKLYYKGQNATRTNDTARNIMADISQHIEFSSQPPLLVASPAITTPSACPIFPAGSSTSLWCTGSGTSQVYAYCIDTTRYSFVIGQQLKDSANHVLWEDTLSPAAATSCTPVNVSVPTPSDTVGGGIAGTGKELLLSGMRLTGFEVAKNLSTGAYDITVDVAYGDDDLLTAAATPPGTDAHPAIKFAQYTPTPTNIHCLSTVGDQFCATANLSTSVMRRLE